MSAYVVFVRERTLDQAELDTYHRDVVNARAGHDVTALARYGAYEVLEGAPMEGAVILKFPSVADAKAWYESPEYRAVAAHRHAGADYRVFVIDGVD